MSDGIIDSEFWKGKKVLLTGHTGFKGSWLSLWLTSMGAQVCGMSLKPNTEPNLYEILSLDDSLESNIVDIRNLDEVSRVVKHFEPEIVLHLAAQALVRDSYDYPLYTYQVNVMGTLHLMQAVRESDSVNTFVIITTDKCYENNETGKGFVEGDPMGGSDPYSNSKGCVELTVNSYRKSFFQKQGVAVATARAGNVIGGGDWSKDRLIPDFFKAIEADETLMIRSPKAVRPWQHVVEPLAGYIMLTQSLYANPDKFSGGWNFAPDVEDVKSVEWVIETLIKISGEGKWAHDGGIHPPEANLLYLNCDKAKEKLKWQPRLSVEESLKWTGDWHKGLKSGDNMSELCLLQIKDYISRIK